MNILIYAIIFIIGSLFGSFFSLAIYRIPLGQDITHSRSYCPKCNHKLGFWDMIPIFSYIFLGGKCRYCKEKIRKRYILLEIFSGIIFLLFALSIDFNFYELEISKLIYFILGILYICTLFIIGGIEKENHNISSIVLLFGLIIETIYIIYLYVIGVSIYRYVIYLLMMLIFIFANTLILRKKGKESYTFQILTLCSYFALASKEEVVIISIIFTLLLIAIKEMSLSRKRNKMEKNSETVNIPVGYYLCFTNIIALIIQNFIPII